jgi:hypothetical protein
MLRLVLAAASPLPGGWRRVQRTRSRFSSGFLKYPDMLRLVLAAASPLLARGLEESPADHQVEILLRIPKIS